MLIVNRKKSLHSQKWTQDRRHSLTGLESDKFGCTTTQLLARILRFKTESQKKSEQSLLNEYSEIKAPLKFSSVMVAQPHLEPTAQRVRRSPSFQYYDTPAVKKEEVSPIKTFAETAGKNISSTYQVRVE